MAQRARYWSCTQFADWLRGSSKPAAATSAGWSQWRTESKGKNPVRYWLAEEGLDMIQNAIWWPIDKLYDLKYYINNRWVTRTHALTAHKRDIPRGEWRDVGNRFLPCLFNELVDFVEVETAWCNIAWNKEARAKYNPPFYAWGWFRWRTWRCKQAGIDHLEWASGLTNEEWLQDGEKHLAESTPQAVAAKEILELYRWWTEVYANRGDPHDLSGWSALCDSMREDGNLLGILDHSKQTPEEAKAVDVALKRCREIEAQYEQEDEEMLIRLIKVRNSLWT